MDVIMNTPQYGILPDASPHARYLCMMLKDKRDAYEIFNQILRLQTDTARRYSEAEFSVVLGIGSQLWEQVFSERPKLLGDFIEQSNQTTQVHAPHTPYDLFVHIRSKRIDVNFEYAKQIVQQYMNVLEVKDEIVGFQYLDNRDLTGFVDGTENPQGNQRAEVALVDDHTLFQNGSYLHIQRYKHHLSTWEALKTKQQEDIIARTKDDNIEYAAKDKLPTAHIKRVNLKYENGAPMEMLRHSMPYGSTQEHGLFFVSYARTPLHFNTMLESMVQGDDEGHTDHLMRYTKAVSGAAFFAPSIEFLQDEKNYI